MKISFSLAVFLTKWLIKQSICCPSFGWYFPSLTVNHKLPLLTHFPLTSWLADWLTSTDMTSRMSQTIRLEETTDFIVSQSGWFLGGVIAAVTLSPSVQVHLPGTCEPEEAVRSDSMSSLRQRLSQASQDPVEPLGSRTVTHCKCRRPWEQTYV